MNRREFLRGAVVLGGAAAVATQVPAWARSSSEPGPSLLTSSAADCPVDTIVVICMENRSFDHYFGWLAADERYLEAGRSRYGRGFAVDGRTEMSFRRPDGSTAHTFHLPAWEQTTNGYRGCGGHPDPGHGRTSGLAQRDHGFVSEGSGNDDYALGYFLESDLPCYAPLARHSTIYDRYFCSTLASTYPNREYLHSAQSGGNLDNAIPASSLGFQWETIWDRLTAAKVPCGMYGVDIPTTALWGTRLLPITHPIAKLFEDAAAGQLPKVTFIDPGFLSGMRTDDHPHGDMRTAQRFVASMLDVLQRSPQWGSMAIFTTYDEWGGFFDHVSPRRMADDLATGDELTDMRLTGFRLPVTVHSPFARPGYVDHRVYDHTSILRLIEWRFLGAPAEGPGGGSGWWLTARDRNANNIGASLAATRVNDFLVDTAAVPFVISTPCDGQAFQDVPGLGEAEDAVTPPLKQAGVDLDDYPVTVSVEGPSVFQAAYDAGLYDRAGYDINPSMSLTELLQA